MEDPDVVLDLRSLNPGRSENTKYDQFWEECDRFLADKTAVNDRRHGTTSRLAISISIRDFIEQVKHHCDSSVLIPSDEWVRLQFWPKTPS